MEKNNKNKLSWYKKLKILIPMHRYLNNSGIHDAFKVLKKYYPKLELLKFNKSDKCGLWTIPLSWEVLRGRLFDPKGRKIADYFKNPLVLHSNSVSFNGKIKKNKLMSHIFSDKRRPNLTPFHYRNQFREHIKDWGFCMPYNKSKKLPSGDYRVQIETRFKKRDMNCAYISHNGEISDTLLLTSHFDHPFQANDGIVGSIAAFEIISSLKKMRTKISYASLAAPEIIGSIFFAKKFAKKKNIKQAIMTSFCGVKSNLVYSKSSRDNTFIDRALIHILKFKKKKSNIVNFREIIGADEIAFDNVLNDIPCGSLYRWPYKYYHSDKDTIENVDTKSFREYCDIIKELIYIIENNSVFTSKFKDLPKLSDPKINLYISPRYWKRKNNSMPIDKSYYQSKSDMQFEKVLNFIGNDDLRDACVQSSENIQILQSMIPAKANGKMSCFDLAEKCKMPFIFVNEYLNMWEAKKLIKKKWISPFIN